MRRIVLVAACVALMVVALAAQTGIFDTVSRGLAQHLTLWTSRAGSRLGLPLAARGWRCAGDDRYLVHHRGRRAPSPLAALSRLPFNAAWESAQHVPVCPGGGGHFSARAIARHSESWNERHDQGMRDRRAGRGWGGHTVRTDANVDDAARPGRRADLLTANDFNAQFRDNSACGCVADAQLTGTDALEDSRLRHAR